MQLKFKRLHPDAVLPSKGTEYAAGFDLTAVEVELKSIDVVAYSTGLSVEIPEGHMGLIFPRSSVYKKDLFLANSVGVIDSDYRGEIKCIFRRTCRGDETFVFGDRVAQLVIVPIPRMEPTWSDTLSDTERGEGGFGSTGN